MEWEDLALRAVIEEHADAPLRDEVQRDMNAAEGGR